MAALLGRHFVVFGVVHGVVIVVFLLFLVGVAFVAIQRSGLMRRLTLRYLHIKKALQRRLPKGFQSKNRGDKTAIEFFSGSFADWTRPLIAIAQALAT